jgi:hypothetical protein
MKLFYSKSRNFHRIFHAWKLDLHVFWNSNVFVRSTNLPTSTIPEPTSSTPVHLVPKVLFFNITKHQEILEEMAIDFELGEHLLLIGSQGTGKNKLTDRFLEILNRPRQYVQLHRDTTVQSLTVQPSLKDGQIVSQVCGRSVVDRGWSVVGRGRSIVFEKKVEIKAKKRKKI